MQAPIFQLTRLDASHNQPQNGATRFVWPLYPPTQPLASGVEASAPLFISDAFAGTPPLSRSSSRTSTAPSSSSVVTPILQNLIMSNIFQENADQYDATLDATAPLIPTLAPPLLCPAKIATGIQPSLPLPPSQHQSVHIDHSSGSSYLPSPGGLDNYADNMSGGETGGTPQASPSGLPTSYPFTFTAYPQMTDILDTLAAMDQGILSSQSALQFPENIGVQAGSVYQQYAESYLLNGANIQSLENLVSAHQQDTSGSGSYLNGANFQSPEDLGGSVYQQHTYNSGSYADGANFQSPDLADQAASVYQPHASNSGTHLNGANFQSSENLGVQLGPVDQQHVSHSENYLNGAILQSPENLGAQDAFVSQQHASNSGNYLHDQTKMQFSQNISVQPGPAHEQHASNTGSHYPQIPENAGMQPGSVYQQHVSNSGSHHLQAVNSQFFGNVGVQPQPVYQQHASNSMTCLHTQANLQFSQNLNVQHGPVYEQYVSNSGHNVTAAPIHHVPNAGPSAPGTSSGTNPTNHSVFVASTNRNSNVSRVNDGSVQTTASDANPVQGTSPAPSATLYVQQIQPSGGLSTVSTRPAGVSGKRSRADFEGKSTNGFSEPPAKQAKKLPVAKQSNINARSIKPKRVVKVKEIKRGIPCHVCMKPVTPGRNWHHEQTLHHRKAKKPETKVHGDWLCQICDDRFARNDSGFRHQERLHGGRFPEMMIFAPLSIPSENNPPQSQ